jgi:hypothetical protein
MIPTMMDFFSRGMMNENLTPEEREAFEDLSHRAGNIVGEREIEARSIMGDSAYESMKNIIDTNNSLQVALTAKQVKHLNAMGNYRQSLATLLYSVPPLLITWSIWFWVVH